MRRMDKKTQLGFTHRFIPSNKSEARITTLLLLHGTGATEEDMIPLGQQIAPEAAILSPRGKILENGMPRFFRRLAEGVFDLEDLKFRTSELADFVNDASKTYDFDLQHVIAAYFYLSLILRDGIKKLLYTQSKSKTQIARIFSYYITVEVFFQLQHHNLS